jgi:GDP-4-dehydro-6-deoxy-D-mannose reductase
MRVLITGAHGFIGLNFARYLSTQKDQELFFTDLQSESAQYKENYSSCDLSDSKATQNLIKSIRPEQIYHLAGTFTNTYEIDFASNYLSTKSLLDTILLFKDKTRILLIGSAAEYGNVAEEDNPIKETQALSPITNYGLTKSLQTLLMRSYFFQYSMNIVMARIFNIVGRGASDKLFVGSLYNQIEQIKRNEINCIEVDSLESKRDYIEINKVCIYLYELMRKGIDGQEYNVGSGILLTMKELISKILAEEGLKRVKISRRKSDNAKNNIFCSCADISKLLSLIKS